MPAKYDIHESRGLQLIKAAESGDLVTAKTLIKKSANVDMNDSHALLLAVYNRHEDVAVELVKAGANIHADSDYALRHAAAAGLTKLVDAIERAVVAERDSAVAALQSMLSQQKRA